MDYENTKAMIQAIGGLRIMLVDDNGKATETPLTLHELIEFIHVTGGAVSRHRTQADLLEDQEAG